MIRKELKTNPIAYMGGDLTKDVYLNTIERLYVINKCPKLFSRLRFKTKLDEKFYLFKMKRDTKDIDISSLRYRENVKKALMMEPELCAYINLEEYQDLATISISKIRNNNYVAYTKILNNSTITNTIIREILMFRPDLIVEIPNRDSFKLDSDLQIYIFKHNPSLIKYFNDISPTFVRFIIDNGMEFLEYLPENSFSSLPYELLVELAQNYIVDDAMENYNIDIMKRLINNDSNILKHVIDAITSNQSLKNSIKSDIIIKRLLREFNHLITDEIAEIVIAANI